MRKASAKAVVKKRAWELPRHTLKLGARTLVMGVINLTPDSFSDGGRFFTRKRGWARAEGMILEGADIIDLGGESTRPGASPVSEKDESSRVQRYLGIMMMMTGDCVYSVDTTKASVARVALKAGVEIVNDISGLRFDPAPADVAAEA